MITLLESQSPQIADIIYFLVAANGWLDDGRAVWPLWAGLARLYGKPLLSDFYKSLIFNDLRFVRKKFDYLSKINAQKLDR